MLESFNTTFNFGAGLLLVSAGVMLNDGIIVNGAWLVKVIFFIFGFGILLREAKK